MRDANEESLNAYMKEQEKAEIAYDNFISVILASDAIIKYEEARDIYNKLSDNYEYDVSFEEFIGDNV